MIRFRYLFPALFVFLGFFVSVFSPLVSATSNFDNAYVSTDTLTVKRVNNGANYSCDPLDISDNWSSYLTDSSYMGIHYSADDMAATKASFLQALSTGSWSVTQVNQNGSNESIAYVVWSEDSMMSLDWVDSKTVQIADTSDLHWSSIYCSATSQGGQKNKFEAHPMVSGSLSTTNRYVSWTIGTTLLDTNYIFTGNPNYPSGYDGGDVVSSHAPPIDLLPAAFTTVDGLDITSSLSIPGYPSGFYPPKFEVNIYKADDDYNPVSDSIFSDVYTDSVQVKGTFGVPFKYTFDTLGKYYMTVDVSQYWHPPLVLPDDANYTFKTLKMPLNIDGSTYTFNTSTGFGMSCGADGTCSPPTPYEDCSTYGTDIVGGFKCVISNFSVWLRSVLVSLFVPDMSSLSETYDQMIGVMSDRLGFVYQSVAIVGGFFSTIVSSAADSNCVLDFGTLHGADPRVDLCSLRDSIGASSFDFAVGLFRASVALSFGFLSYYWLLGFFRGYHNSSKVGD